jgi:hypothetical protein
MKRRKSEEGFGKALDLWQAPDHAGQPLVCIATTYTFDATFFETECIGRFLQMDSHPSESESVAYLIEREEKLAGARVHALVDRRHARDKESLRWDVIGILVPKAVQHAKLAVLCWANHVRVVVGSGNLTEPGYRKNVEVFGALEISRADGGNKKALSAVLDFLTEVSSFAVGEEGANTPRGRLAESLDRIREHVRRWPVVESDLDGLPIFTTPRRSSLQQLEAIWPSGSPIREAYVVSPFFDHSPNDARAADGLKRLMAKRGARETYFYVKTEAIPDGRTRVYAPKGLMTDLAEDALVEVMPLTTEQNDEIREVHSKLLAVGNDTWRLLMIGSSNFTSAGLGLVRGSGNCEANLVYAVKLSSHEFRRMDTIWPEFVDEPLDLDDQALIWEPAFEEDEEGVGEHPLPASFEEALFLAEEPRRLKLTLTGTLPASWVIRVPSGRLVLDSSQAGTGTHVIPWEETHPPFVLEVCWTHSDGESVASWPVNVANPAALPPPEVLRQLTLEDLLEILASTRPLSQAVVAAIKKKHAPAVPGSALDPLKRFDSKALLLRRTKRVARALDRLRERLERPALTKDAFEWRLRGAVGPLALADAFVKEARLPGEAHFCLAELALALRRVRPEVPAQGGLPASEITTCLNQAIREVQDRATQLGKHPDAVLLDEYVARAFEEAAGA